MNKFLISYEIFTIIDDKFEKIILTLTQFLYLNHSIAAVFEAYLINSL